MTDVVWLTGGYPWDGDPVGGIFFYEKKYDDRKGTKKPQYGIAGTSLPHDMAFTKKYTVLHDLSLTYDPDAFKAGRHKLRFFGERPARFAVIPRHGDASQIRWFEAEPCFIYHVINAWDDGDEVVMVGCRYRTPRDLSGAPDEERYAKAIAHLQIDAYVYEWRFNLRTGQTRERLIDDQVARCASSPILVSGMAGA